MQSLNMKEWAGGRSGAFTYGDLQTVRFDKLSLGVRDTDFLSLRPFPLQSQAITLVASPPMCVYWGRRRKELGENRCILPYYSMRVQYSTSTPGESR